MPSDIENYLSQIRTAVYGRDVRDAIVNSIEQCYTDTSTGVTAATEAAATAADNTSAAINHMQTMYNALEDGMDTLMDQAESAISDANAAATAAQTAGTALSNNAQDIVLVQQNEPTNKPYNKVWVKPQVTEVEVPTYEEFSDLKSAFEKTTVPVIGNPADYVVGTINSADGTTASGNGTEIRSNSRSSAFTKIDVANGYYCCVCAFDGTTYKGMYENGNLYTSKKRLRGTVDILIPDGHTVRFVIGNDAGNQETVAEAVALTVYETADTSLTKSGIAADSATVGAKFQSIEAYFVEEGSPVA